MLGLEQELALACGSLETTIEAFLTRAGIRSYFGVDDRILIIPCGHGPRREVVAQCFAGSPGRLASCLSFGSGRALKSILRSPALLESTVPYDLCLAEAR